MFNKGGGRPGILRRATDFAWPEAGIQRGFKVIIKFDVFPPGFSRPTDRDTKYAGGLHADEKNAGEFHRAFKQRLIPDIALHAVGNFHGQKTPEKECWVCT